ncbi:MAG TPA: helix-turn-helix domain-containing protein [Solirubrobacteraceae bacterium]|nr:helix-turn-helix domain-containing protein [Solirubrobacteraceae bacterium]
MDEIAGLVGERLRAARRARGLSLGALARVAGVGKGSLSEIENGTRNPTLATLYALAGALGVPLATLLAERVGAEIASPGVRAVLLDVTDDGAQTVEVYRLRLDAGARRDAGAHGPGVTEHLLLVAGALRAGPAGEEVALSVGDSATWVSDVAHSYVASGDRDADAVLVIRSPRAAAAGSGAPAASLGS